MFLETKVLCVYCDSASTPLSIMCKYSVNIIFKVLSEVSTSLCVSGDIKSTGSVQSQTIVQSIVTNVSQLPSRLSQPGDVLTDVDRDKRTYKPTPRRHGAKENPT